MIANKASDRMRCFRKVNASNPNAMYGPIIMQKTTVQTNAAARNEGPAATPEFPGPA